MNALDVAVDYIPRGWSPVPIPSREGPGARAGRTCELRADPPKHFNGAPQNVGVILGEPSGDLADADLDCPEALVLARLLPPTDSVFGRAGKPRSHRLYVSAVPKAVEFEDPDDGETMLVELRSMAGRPCSRADAETASDRVARGRRPARGRSGAIEQGCEQARALASGPGPLGRTATPTCWISAAPSCAGGRDGAADILAPVGR